MRSLKLKDWEFRQRPVLPKGKVRLLAIIALLTLAGLFVVASMAGCDAQATVIPAVTSSTSEVIQHNPPGYTFVVEVYPATRPAMEPVGGGK
jgi:hypothetical protein